jgi:hypothetical protein
VQDDVRAGLEDRLHMRQVPLDERCIEMHEAPEREDIVDGGSRDSREVGPVVLDEPEIRLSDVPFHLVQELAIVVN